MNDLPEFSELALSRRQSCVITTLNRPDVKNALSGTMINELFALCDWMDANKEVRALVLRGADGVFCSGGDIKEFGKQIVAPAPAEGEADPVAKSNRVFGDLLLRLDGLPQTMIAVIEGPAFGGAMGLISVADIALAKADAKFALSETSIGIPPAQIGPFVVRKIGLFSARRLALTGTRFGPEAALAFGLVDKIAADGQELDADLTALLGAIGRCEPAANAATKRIFNAAGPAIDRSVLDDASIEFAQCLRGAGREGAMAFAAKKAPPWVEVYKEAEKS